MGDRIYRFYTEKKPGFDVLAKSIQNELSLSLGLPGISLRLFNRYDIQNLPDGSLQSVRDTVLSEPMSDLCYDEHLPPLPEGALLLYVESLPGQFDVRADSCEQCIELLLGGGRPVVRTALVYAIEGAGGDGVAEKIKSYLINPVECREASPDKPSSLLTQNSRKPGDIPVVDRFIKLSSEALTALIPELGLAMPLADILFVQEYFRRQRRNPTLTELRVIDTYWSDHCRHTTFNTLIESADIHDERVRKAYGLFLSVNGDRPVTLMNIATGAMRRLRDEGGLPMLDESDEINACTVKVSADFDHGSEDWLLFFKNETHNHPTEIEPFGGAATCIGGAIRDPLSGRAYVHQAMRITGSGDPRNPIENTLPGKLPQRKITTTAAAGFSSYGNQIGLATGYVRELYHDGYIAKRLEAGAVVGAAPLSAVRRERPAPGDVVVLLGGRTGRDGIGGATGSSKIHDAGTVSEGASEVQKGNAIEERKLQRLFRDSTVTALIKKCNDFGAGGAAVAIGELADGVEITLDNMPVKYDGMDGTELAISESQERLAVVVAESGLQKLISLAGAENIEATAVARITGKKSLVMTWRGRKIVDINRAFLDTNGPRRHAKALVPDYRSQTQATKSGPQKLSTQTPTPDSPLSSLSSLSSLLSPLSSHHAPLLALCGDLNFCSQKGLVHRFDHSIGAASVFEPYGGKFALTETQVMAALLPASGVRTASVMAYGFDPYFTEADPFSGSAYAVVSSVAKLVASGVSPDTVHLSLQEYFPSPGDEPKRWGLPFAALLGAFEAQLGLKIAAIGGKDSMSGSFGDLDVPPTLISFAVGIADAPLLISPEFKGIGNPVYLLETPMDPDGLPDYIKLRAVWDKYIGLIRSGKILSARSCETGGVCGGILKMAFGNMIGFTSNVEEIPLGCLKNDAGGKEVTHPFEKRTKQLSAFNCQLSNWLSMQTMWGSIVFESCEEIDGFPLLGYTQAAPSLTFGKDNITLLELCVAWQIPLEGVFPTRTDQQGDAPLIKCERRPEPRTGAPIARPKAVIPVFPGTNCEYDTAGAIENAGGTTDTVLIRNLTPEMLRQSVDELYKAISSAQMIVFPGGFSGGDEPDGSGKFIVSLFRNERLTEAVHKLLYERDGLILGICNGFQALIKLGLLPYGRISPMSASCPTLTFNRIGRHQAHYVSTIVSSAYSPWLSKCTPGEIYVQPVSHGEGRFIADDGTLEKLAANGHIAFQYVDIEGLPSMDITYNPNGSMWAVEGICSPCGRVLGKMAHTERHGDHVAANIPGNKYLPLFEGGIDYFL